MPVAKKHVMEVLQKGRKSLDQLTMCRGAERLMGDCMTLLGWGSLRRPHAPFHLSRTAMGLQALALITPEISIAG